MVTDSTRENMYLGGTTNTISLSQGSNDFMIVKYSLTSNSVSWFGTLGSDEDDILESLVIEDIDSTTQGLYALGYSSNFDSSIGRYDGIVIKINPTTLKIEWQIYFGGTESDILYSSYFDVSLSSLILGGMSSSFNEKKSNNGMIVAIDYLGRSQ